MGLLTRMEEAVEHFETALVDKVFRHEPVEVLDALRRECDDHVLVVSEERRLAPNAYLVELAGPVHDRLDSQEAGVCQELTDELVRHAAERGYDFPGPVAVHLTRTDTLPNGRYRISSAASENLPAALFTAGT
ncbi:DUF3662 domain-containing protein [Streptomyces sp. NPDC059740]|uniref:DUF3662 domain-containing protein n=1 Tax=Streptomyces sp. NPDC059740 TaxID=3346926 RepID=UPI003666AB16